LIVDQSKNPPARQRKQETESHFIVLFHTTESIKPHYRKKCSYNFVRKSESPSSHFEVSRRPHFGNRVTPHGESRAWLVKSPSKKLNMKIILLTICVLTLLNTSGCIVADNGRHHDQAAVFVPVVPVVVVHPAVVHVRVY
jgi:hypothetical protein